MAGVVVHTFNPSSLETEAGLSGQQSEFQDSQGCCYTEKKPPLFLRCMLLPSNLSRGIDTFLKKQSAMIGNNRFFF